MVLRLEDTCRDHLKWATKYIFPGPAWKQQQPDEDLDLVANRATHADSQAVPGDDKQLILWMEESFPCFARQVNSFASEGMDIEDSSVQFASSYGAGSSYGASPQYTQVDVAHF